MHIDVPSLYEKFKLIFYKFLNVPNAMYTYIHMHVLVKSIILKVFE